MIEIAVGEFRPIANQEIKRRQGRLTGCGADASAGGSQILR